MPTTEFAPRKARFAFVFINSLLPAIALVSFGQFAAACAQNIQARPIARLISDVSAASRPRTVSASTSPTGGPARTSFVSWVDASAIERRAFEATNAARQQNALQPLVWDESLCAMARAYSERMATAGFFSHETPDGLQLKDRAHQSGIHFRVIGENIAYNKGYDDPGGFAVERWLISPGHRANILYVGFEASAIGSYIAADGSIYLTQVFIAR